MFYDFDIMLAEFGKIRPLMPSSSSALAVDGIAVRSLPASCIVGDAQRAAQQCEVQYGHPATHGAPRRQSCGQYCQFLKKAGEMCRSFRRFVRKLEEKYLINLAEIN